MPNPRSQETDLGGDPREHDADIARLPEESILDLGEYLAMQKALGHVTRFKLATILAEAGPSTAPTLVERLDTGQSSIYYHLNKLSEVGIVNKRMRNADATVRYYTLTALGETLLNNGVRELIDHEWELRGEYDSSASDNHD